MIDNYLNAVEAQIRSERLIVTLEIERVHTSQITKHSPSGVQAAHRPRLEDVMREIEENVVSRLLGES